ncbi:SDR family NAD(P)-dependent oxidoreductase [Actinoplanes sp. NPDC051861]|uniref:SDR family NAD(P)-dependent oxidoreductase n=1 Tax=Actinoplanes sp. NPDC051861 TaxID=3155170 RepID=UPI003427B488
MSRILVTGSTDGLGRAAADSLLTLGHDVVVHARNPSRATALDPLADRGARVVVADFARRDEVEHLAAELPEPFDAVIHNAGVYTGPDIMPVNVIAPYLLTALMPLPQRLVYLSSGSHYSGRPKPSGVVGSYADSKLFVTTLAAAVARLYPDVLSNAVDPGWVPTKMGGPGAPDDLELGHRTQEWLVTSEEPRALVSGAYWYHQQMRAPHEAVNDEEFQERLLRTLAEETGVSLP